MCRSFTSRTVIDTSDVASSGSSPPDLSSRGACHAHHVARRAQYGVHASDGSAAGARRIANARDRCGGVWARGKEAHRVDVLALAQGALNSGARGGGGRGG